MFNKRICSLLFLLIISTIGIAQDCDYTISGTVMDENTGTALSFVHVIVQELGLGADTDDEGKYVIENICHGDYHIIVSHIGCEPKEYLLHIHGDEVLDITLSHSDIHLEGATVEGNSSTTATQPSTSIGKQAIADNMDDNLSGLLEKETGVHLIRNGSGISKPVVHGMYGNRLTILNNGIPQSGQQWGNDHSPEIDPLIANKITIIKGTAALEYGGGNLGSIILVEPQKIGRDPHLHGNAGYSFETNGRGHNANLQLQRYSSALAWRLNGTFKRYGDRNTPDYFLNNTGLAEANLALQLEKSWEDKLFMDIYASTFNTELGVLRGSHIGNLTDLELAFDRDEPFSTEPNFSYNIEAPRQRVSHHLLKIAWQYAPNEKEFFKLVLAGQVNNRKEYDIRRGDRSSRPAMSLFQITYNTDLKYQKEFDQDWTLKMGVQTIFTDNTNNPETGVSPLIPDYFSLKSGLYTTADKSWDKLGLHLGVRYDFDLQNAAVFTNTIPKELIQYKNRFHNLSAALGLEYPISKSQTLTLNMGYTTRNPAINELYSFGLHQGVSGIEEGDINLDVEKASKTSLGYTLQPNAKFSFGALFYYQSFDDYIYLSPQDEYRLTIRGAFPVFIYEQTDARIFGLDLSTQFSLGKALISQLKYSYIKGQDTSNDLPLVFTPPNSLHHSLTYQSKRSINIFGTKLEDVELEWNNRVVFHQSDILPEQDFAPPPDTYYVTGLKASANMILPKYKLRLFVKIDNVLNTRYRDYLNRQRYFADDLGRSTVIGVNLKF